MYDEKSLSKEVLAKESHEKASAYFKVAEEYGYKFIMEVKDIREKRHYIALGYETFDSYCESAWNVKRGYMDERIQIAEAYGNESSFDRARGQMGHKKSLLLAQLNPEKREELMSQPQILSNGSSKTVDEMTTRELQEVSKTLKDRERELRDLQNSNKSLKDTIQSLKNQPPRTKEVIKEVVPDHVRKELEDTKVDLQNETRDKRLLQTMISNLEDEKRKLQDIADESNNEFLNTRRKEELLKSKSHVSMFELQIQIQDFITKSAPALYLQGAMAYADNYVKRELIESAKALERYVDNLKDYLSDRPERSRNEIDIIEINQTKGEM